MVKKEQDWFVVRNGKRVAKIEYESINAPFLIFRVVLLDPNGMETLTSAFADSDNSTYLEACKSKETVESTDFIPHQIDNKLLNIRFLF